MRKNSLLFLVLTLCFALFTLNFACASTDEVSPAKKYDGVWFLGFNMHKDIFTDKDGLAVRKAFITAIDRKWITENLVHDTVVPVGMVPPGLSGYDGSLAPTPFDPLKAKQMMKDAGYTTSDKRLKTLTLLHTDGQLTMEIAKWIKRYLITLGVDLQLVKTSYSDYSEWESALKSGKYHMFLMGYKPVLFDQIFIGDKNTRIFHTIDCAKTPSAEAIVFLSSYDEAVNVGYKSCSICAPVKKDGMSGLDMIAPLFEANSEDNLTFYDNARLNSLISQIYEMSPALKEDREEKLRELSKILLDDPPAVPLFYITAL